MPGGDRSLGRVPIFPRRSWNSSHTLVRAGNVLAEHVEVRERVAEEVGALEPAGDRLVLVAGAHHRRDAGHLRIDRQPNGHALGPQGRLVVVDPCPGLLGLDEGEGQGADPLLGREEIVSRRLQATQSGGCGFCTGFGTTLRGGICTNRPSTPPNGVSVMQRIATSRPSSQASRLLAGSMPKPPSSASEQDSPEPNSTRPLETRSSVATRSAVRAGWL